MLLSVSLMFSFCKISKIVPDVQLKTHSFKGVKRTQDTTIESSGTSSGFKVSPKSLMPGVASKLFLELSCKTGHPNNFLLLNLSIL